MRVVVFGASGRVGRELVVQGRERGHDVVAVVRPGSDGPPGETARLQVLDDPLEPLLEGADAVLSGLGMRRRFEWNPWSQLTSPDDLCSRSAERIVAAMQGVGVGRAVAISAAGVGDSAPGMNPVIRGLVASSSIGVAYRDLARMERVYEAVEACCVRPVTLTNGRRTEQVREVDHFGALMSISRADVAWWCWERLALDELAGTPQISG